jgi:hypothetical protein
MNITATIQGRLTVPGGQLPYGMNCLVYSHPAGVGNALTQGLPVAGVGVGFHRLLASDVVGSTNTNTGAKCSGIFVIQGIPLPGFVPAGSVPFFAGLRHDLVWEAMECSGAGLPAPPAGAYGSPSEWVSEPYLNPSPNNSWTPLAIQTALVCNTTGAGGAPAVYGSLELTAGTIIDLGTVSHNGIGNNVDAGSRPLIEIVPRLTRPTGAAPIVIHISSYNNLNLATASLTVNGVPFTNLSQYQQPVIGPPSWEWQIPANVLLGPGSQLVRFTVTEAAGSLPPGRIAVPGINQVQY